MPSTSIHPKFKSEYNLKNIQFDKTRRFSRNEIRTYSDHAIPLDGCIDTVLIYDRENWLSFSLATFLNIFIRFPSIQQNGRLEFVLQIDSIKRNDRLQLLSYCIPLTFHRHWILFDDWKNSIILVKELFVYFLRYKSKMGLLTLNFPHQTKIL